MERSKDMNRILWKLDHIGERLWILATMVATQSAALASEGKGVAIVAEEIRNLSNKVIYAVEKSVVDGEELNSEKIATIAFQLKLLALNGSFEAFRLRERGKQTAIYVDEIRNLAYEILCLFDKVSQERVRKISKPWPANVISSVNQGCECLQFNIDGIDFYEALDNVQEVCDPVLERRNGNIILRSMELPLIDGYKLMGKSKAETPYVIIRTPWADQNKLYAVAADIDAIHRFPIGKPIDAPSEMPLSKYVRECWENENGEPFYFMNWAKMI